MISLCLLQVDAEEIIQAVDAAMLLMNIERANNSATDSTYLQYQLVSIRDASQQVPCTAQCLLLCMLLTACCSLLWLTAVARPFSLPATHHCLWLAATQHIIGLLLDATSLTGIAWLSLVLVVPRECQFAQQTLTLFLAVTMW